MIKGLYITLPTTVFAVPIGAQTFSGFGLAPCRCAINIHLVNFHHFPLLFDASVAFGETSLDPLA